MSEKTEKQRLDDNFEFYGIRERIAYNDIIWQNKKIKLVDGGFTPAKSNIAWDCLLQSGNTNFCIEIKIRNHFSTKFDDWLFEELKLKTLRVNAEEGGYKKLLCVILLDQAVYWDISNSEDFTFKKEWLREKTITGSEKKVLKSVTYLKIKDAIEVIPCNIDHELLWQRSLRKFKKEKGYDFVKYIKK